MALWLRVITTTTHRIANLDMRTPLLRLRKHAANASKTHAQTQRESMLRAVQYYMGRLEGDEKNSEIEIEVVGGMVDVKNSGGMEEKVIELVERLSTSLCSKPYISLFLQINFIVFFIKYFVGT